MKKLVESGVVARIEAGHPAVRIACVRLEIDGTFSLNFGRCEDGLEIVLLESRGKKTRQFKSLDTANNFAKRLGFTKVIVLNNDINE